MTALYALSTVRWNNAYESKSKLLHKQSCKEGQIQGSTYSYKREKQYRNTLIVMPGLAIDQE